MAKCKWPLLILVNKISMCSMYIIFYSQLNNAPVGLDLWMFPIVCVEVGASSSECPSSELPEKIRLANVSTSLKWLNNLESHAFIYFY